jgi:zinc protease
MGAPRLGLVAVVGIPLWLAAGVLAGGAGSRVQPPAPPQAPPSIQGAELKGRAPVSDEVLQISLPRAREIDLDNGIHLIVLENRRVPMVSFQVQIEGAGGYYDSADAPGLAGAAAAMLREGTASRSSREISESLETVASFVNVGSGAASPFVTVFASSLSEHLDRTLEIVADFVQRPTFPEDELGRWKTQQRAMLTQQRANPGFLAAERFGRVMYGQHPASRVAPTIEAIDALTRAKLVAFHEERYVPDFTTVAVAGDISFDEARARIERAFAGWKKRGHPRPQVTDPSVPGPRAVSFVDRPNSVQTNLLVGVPAISRTSPEYDVFEVLNKIVGGGPTGRLFMNLREDKGYTYGAYSFVSAPRHRGVWQASTQVRSDVTEPALKELLHEVERLRTELVPEKEFAEARRSIVASYALSLESPEQLLGLYVTRHIYGLPADYLDTRPARIMAVTREDVQALARKYFDPAHLQIVAVGTHATIGKSLDQFGPVTTYSVDGDRIDGR